MPQVGFEAKRQGAVYDDVATRAAVVAIMERHGFAVAMLDGPGASLVGQLRDVAPGLVVLDLASAASRGLRIVEDLHTSVPTCAIVLLAPFEGLRGPALSVGAYDLVGTEDLRDLERCLRRLTAELDARDSAALRAHPCIGAEATAQGKGEQKPVAVAGEITTTAPRQASGDGESQAGAAFAVHADETLKSVVDGFLRDP